MTNIEKNRKNNKCNKILDLEKEQFKKGPEMSANIAKIANITRVFLEKNHPCFAKSCVCCANQRPILDQF